MAINRPAMAMQFFMSKTFPDGSPVQPHQAAGIVGNFMQESGRNLDPGAIGDNGTSYGIYQVRGSRFASLKRMADKKGTKWNDFKTQLDHAWYEMNNSERSTLVRLQAAKNVDQATAAVIGFERPKGWSPNNPRGGHGWSNRLQYAQSIEGGAGTDTMAGGDKGTKDTKRPFDTTAKDDQIPIKDQDPMRVASEIDFSDEGDLGYTPDTSFDWIQSVPDDEYEDDYDPFETMIGEPPPEPRGDFGSFFQGGEDGTIEPDILGIGDPPPEIPLMGEIPGPPTTFRDILLGRGVVRQRDLPEEEA